jgi:hypothetical protein
MIKYQSSGGSNLQNLKSQKLIFIKKNQILNESITLSSYGISDNRNSDGISGNMNSDGISGNRNSDGISDNALEFPH